MSITTPGPRNDAFSQATNLAAFCRELCQTHAARTTRQRVTIQCDVAGDLSLDFPRDLVRRILNAWIEEALDEMPDGGELEISVVRGARALEIEVADSRETDIHELQDYWHRHIQISDDSVVDGLAEADLQVEMMRCPQGGIARTVLIPHRGAVANNPSRFPWRKAA